MPSLLFQKHKKIGIFGLSKTGTFSYKVLHKVAEVICYDQNAAHQEEFARHYGKKNIVDLLDPRWEKLDKIVLSPGVPLTHDIVKIANANNILITSDIELLFEENPLANYIAITGTNGKSTTVSLIGHILLSCKFDYQVGGNIGIPALSMNLNSFGYVLELSSFQLDLLNSFKAKIAILLNISKDHLDRYGSMKNYIASKKKIFDRLNKESFAIISVDNPITNNLFEQLIIENQTNLIPISTNKILNGGVSVSHNIIYDNIAESLTFNLPANKYLQGVHNQENIAASYAACRIAGVLPEKIINAIIRFKGLSHRMQYIGSIFCNISDLNGKIHLECANIKSEINFYNDSKATNADAAYSSISSLENIYWLAGGIAKAGGIKMLAPLFPKIHKAYLFGQDKEMLALTLKGKVKFQICRDLTEAFNFAFIEAKKDINRIKNILLAPACASFDQFSNFEERGKLFIKLYNIVNG